MERKFGCMYMNHPSNNMMYGKNKIRVREKPKKGVGHIVKGIVEIKIKIVEVENHSLCSHICSLNYTLAV